RDRRRRDARDPADRRHAAVRLLRRLVDRRQLRARRAAAARLRPRAKTRRPRCRTARRPAMNAPIVRLFALVIVLFALLVAFTSRWSVFEAEALRDNPNNRRLLFEEQRIKRGIIRADDGTVLAANRALSQDRFERRYPTGELFAHPVGFSSLDRGRIGLEDYYNDALTGRRNDAIGTLERLLGPQDVGDDLRTALDPKAQEAAFQALAGQPGAVVAMDIKSGAVRVLAATPSYNPNDPKNAKTFNRATQGRFPPGSTMKTVTAAAALDTGKYTPDSTISGKNNQVISGTPLQNF